MPLNNQWTPNNGNNIKPKVFPGNVEDVEKFKTDIATMLYSKQQLPHIVDMLKKGAQALPVTIGHLAAITVTTILMRRAKEGGERVHIKLLFYGLKDAIMILNKIAEKIGVGSLDAEGVKKASDVAGEVSAKMLEKQQQPVQEEQPQPILGQPQQVMQGAPSPMPEQPQPVPGQPQQVM